MAVGKNISWKKEKEKQYHVGKGGGRLDIWERKSKLKSEGGEEYKVLKTKNFIYPCLDVEEGKEGNHAVDCDDISNDLVDEHDNPEDVKAPQLSARSPLKVGVGSKRTSYNLETKLKIIKQIQVQSKS